MSPKRWGDFNLILICLKDVMNPLLKFNSKDPRPRRLKRIVANNQQAQQRPPTLGRCINYMYIAMCLFKKSSKRTSFTILG